MADLDAPITESRASVRYLHVSPYKVRPVLDLIRGLAAEDAERILQLAPRSAAGDVLKVLESAIANSENRDQEGHAALPADELYIVECYCNEGPTRPAGRARARGRSFRIRKRTSHITIVLDQMGDDQLEARRRRQEETGTGRGASTRRRSERVRASRRPEAHDHDHDHDHDQDHEEAIGAGEVVPEDIVEVPVDEHDVDVESGEAVEAEADAADGEATNEEEESD
jgi:large subunit ribosomal protein L22